MKLRIATFNVENLFSRALILNLNDHKKTDELLEKVKDLQNAISQATYTDAVRAKVTSLSIELKAYVDFRKDAGSLGEWKKDIGFVINKSCKGRGDWIGELVFKEKPFTDQQRKNTGKVIKTLDADILCAVEVEGMDVLRAFNSQVLGAKKFEQYLMIDSPNDPRGIDVACLTKHKILSARSHVFDDGTEFKPVFSRDCLEVAIDVGLNQPVFVLCNHFKSQGGKGQEEQDKGARKRKEQTEQVAKILASTYNLNKDYVIVLGDLNEDSSNAYQSLNKLFQIPGLHPVVDPKINRKERYTYYYAEGSKDEKLSQLDYIFLSEPLHNAVTAFGFERRGISEIDKIAGKFGLTPVTPFPEVTTWDTSASDHAGLWVEVDLL